MQAVASKRTASVSKPKASVSKRKVATLAPPTGRDVSVQLATLVDKAPTGDAWVYETKYDGYRIVARVHEGEVQLSTRTGLDFTARAPGVVKALAGLSGSLLLDGELVSPPRGKDKSRMAGDFQALQNALREGRSAQLAYYAFDLLFADGRDLRELPLTERKQELAEVLKGADPHVQLSRHLAGDGALIFRKACELGIEGIIAKRADGRYVGGRGKGWLKVKCLGREEFVVVGFTPPSGSRQHLGALLVATRDAGTLRYAGKVGTGFSQASLADLARRFARLRRDTPPLSPYPRGAQVRGVQWLEPQLVVEVEFTEFTSDGHLRHPSFQGIREDKPAREVKRERPLL